MIEKGTQLLRAIDINVIVDIIWISILIVFGQFRWILWRGFLLCVYPFITLIYTKIYISRI